MLNRLLSKFITLSTIDPESEIPSVNFEGEIGVIPLVVDCATFTKCSADFEAVLANVKVNSYLVFNDCDLKEVPEVIARMPIHDLQFNNCGIESVPEFLWNMKNLRSITFLNCKVASLPENMPAKQFKRINLSGNRITRIPDALFQTDYLYVSNNPIEEIDTKVSFKQTVAIYAIGCGLKKFSIPNCKYVQLKLSNNDLESISVVSVHDLDVSLNPKFRGTAMCDAFTLQRHGEVSVSYTVMGKDRNVNQDRMAIHPERTEFAVCDGHGPRGHNVAQTCLDKLISGERIFNVDSTSGSTATVVTIDNNIATASWLGDSRAICVRDGEVVFTTIDHDSDNAAECARIKACGAEIAENRLGGILDVTRAFGDKSVKGVSAEFEVATFEVLPGDIVVVASDGVWGKLSNDIVAKAVSYTPDAKQLVELAVAYGSMDDITAIVYKVV